MNFLIALVLAYVFCVVCKEKIKKQPEIFYIGTTIIALIQIFGSVPENIFGDFFNTLFRFGTFGTALITLVMYMNAVPSGHKLMKNFMPIRGELSIIASILILTHNIIFGKWYLVCLFTDISMLGGSITKILASVLTVLMIAMLIPLFLTSFKCVRKKMDAKKWKKLQQMAYPFYMLIYYHVMLLMIPHALEGEIRCIINVFVYSVVFNGYAVMRITKEYAKSNKPSLQLLLVAIMMANIGVAMCSAPTPVVEAGDESVYEVVEELESDELDEDFELVEGDLDLDDAGFELVEDDLDLDDTDFELFEDDLELVDID